ncbi:MAG: iron-sulfur cluster repair protein YtfE [Pseudomonadota bacterium]
MSARQQFASTTSELAEQTLGNIAVQLPGATAVFRDLKLDFCCNGNISLRQAALNKNIDLTDVLGQLAALERPSPPPDETTTDVLIDHILTRYHDVHRAQLPELIRMAHRVETVHKSNPQVPAGLAQLLEDIQQVMLEHMAKEEQVLFPMLKAGGNPFVGQPIGMMRSEHISHGAALDRVNALTHDATPPPGACNTWRALYTGIAQFNEDLINHIHLENNVLFPKFEASAVPEKSGCGGGGNGCGCS